MLDGIWTGYSYSVPEHAIHSDLRDTHEKGLDGGIVAVLLAHSLRKQISTCQLMILNKSHVSKYQKWESEREKLGETVILEVMRMHAPKPP